jgi:hypothetical protein
MNLRSFPAVFHRGLRMGVRQGTDDPDCAPAPVETQEFGALAFRMLLCHSGMR